MLSKKAFRAWLEARKDKVVGLTERESSCPIAHYLTEQTGQGATVLHHYYWIGGKGYTLPEWAAAFVQQVDGEPNVGGAHVTGEQALAILDRIKGDDDAE